MTKALAIGSLVLMMAVGASAGAGQTPASPSKAIQPVSWDAWLAAKVKAEENDAAGNLVAALQYYLEYTRQAEGLNNPSRVALGKNNAAYMIIKMHHKDASVDLAPARKLLEEGLGVEGLTGDCRKVLEMNLEYVRSAIGTPR